MARTAVDDRRGFPPWVISILAEILPFLLEMRLQPEGISRLAYIIIHGLTV